MTLKNIFSKPIDRPLEGVLKADDETSLPRIEEYVLPTKSRNGWSPSDAYNNYKGANGVWISGFFGFRENRISLKILALLLENRQIGRNFALTFFVKCGDNGSCCDIRRR